MGRARVGPLWRLRGARIRAVGTGGAGASAGAPPRRRPPVLGGRRPPFRGSYTYDPYGSLAASTGSVPNPFGYAGGYTDTESGLEYLTNRYYDPTTAQFLSVDPLVPTDRPAV